MKKIYCVFLILFLDSCLLRISRVELKPVEKFNYRIGSYGGYVGLKTHELESVNTIGSRNKIGYKIIENIVHKQNRSAIVSNDIIEVINQSFSNWLKSSNYTVSNDHITGKNINVKLGYYNIQPIIEPMTKNLKVDVAIKVEVTGYSDNLVFSKWYFVDELADDISLIRDEDIEEFANKSLTSILNKIFQDQEFIKNIR